MPRWSGGVLHFVVATGCAGNPVESTSQGADATGAAETTGAASTSASAANTSQASSGTGGHDADSASDSAAQTGTTGSDSGASTGSSHDASTGSSEDTSPDASGTSTGSVMITCDDLDEPDGPPRVCSQNSNASATFRVVNGCATEAIEVFWVNYDCDEITYEVISPGNEWEIDSYDTHPWRIRASSDLRLLAEVPPLTGDTTIELPTAE